MNNKLYLASQSLSRKKLLDQSAIPYTIVAQQADEYACDWTLPLEKLVESIAIHKMDCLNVGDIPKEDRVWVLTADTLGQDGNGHIYGKPTDHADAVSQLKAQRDHWVRVATSFCVDRKVFADGAWQTEQRITQTVVSHIIFSITDTEIDAYIDRVNACACAGTISIDGFGAQYLKQLNGSYSSVIGLPLFEVRDALKQLDFF